MKINYMQLPSCFSMRLPGGTCITVLNSTNNSTYDYVYNTIKYHFSKLIERMGTIKRIHLFIPASSTNDDVCDVIGALYELMTDDNIRSNIKRIIFHLFYYKINGKNEPNRYTQILRVIFENDKDEMKKFQSWVKLDGTQYNTFSISSEDEIKICVDNRYIQKTKYYGEYYEIPALVCEYNTKLYTSICMINSMKIK